MMRCYMISISLNCRGASNDCVLRLTYVLNYKAAVSEKTKRSRSAVADAYILKAYFWRFIVTWF